MRFSALLFCIATAFAQSGNSPFANLKFREIGPATVSGRIDDFAVLESNPAIFYVASATGGIWKTVNAGTTFEAIFQDQSTSTIGDIAIAPNDANLIWAGTGENNNRQSTSWGDGVFKSTDGGRTWKNMGLRQSMHIARVLVDPVDHDVVYVAALGSVFGPGGDRGVYKTTDGGLTWSRSLVTDDDTGATELLMDPTNNKVLYAATYQRRRAPWGFNGGGPGSAMWKSTDAGRSWIKLTKGVPEGDKGRIGLDIYRKNPNVLYARIEHEKESGVYRSDDAGSSWRKVSSLNPRPMYFSQIRIDPASDQRIYVLGVELHISDDGGKTFRGAGAQKIHVDYHAMWINPANPDHLLLGGDGGVGISHDRSATYVWLNNLPVSQFYHITFDMRDPYYVCGGLQDNNSFCGPSSVRSAAGIANDDWFVIAGGDGFVAAADPQDSRILYAESQGGRISRVDRVTNERKQIQPTPPEGEKPYRWNWDTPFQISPHNPATLYIGANRVFQSSDRGNSWKAISPDITANGDRGQMQIMGIAGKDTKIARNDGVAAFGTITTLAESPKRAGLYFAGSDDGRVHICKDSGAKWENITAKIPGLPANTYVSRLTPSNFDEKVVYAAFDGHRSNDFGTYLYVSRDQGNTWRSIASNMPKGEVARTITEDHRNPEVLYAGTETGLFVSVDAGASWERIRGSLPTVPIYEITLHPRDNAMILATHGRGVWILDDLSVLQNLAEARRNSLHLFPIKPAVQRRAAADRMHTWVGDRFFLGKNPPFGAVIAYHLGGSVKEISLNIRDASGATIRELKGDIFKDSKTAGIQTVVWDLRVEPLPRRTGSTDNVPAFFGGGGDGPLVLPGSYEALLRVDGQETPARKFEVKGDPETLITEADRKRRFEAQMELHRIRRSIAGAGESLSALNDRLNTIKAALKDNKDAAADLKQVEALSKQFVPIGREFGVGGPSSFEQTTTADFELASRALQFRVSMLNGAIASSTSALTDQQGSQLRAFSTALPKEIAKANEMITAGSKLIADLAARGIYPAALKPVPSQ